MGIILLTSSSWSSVVWREGPQQWTPGSWMKWSKDLHCESLTPPNSKKSGCMKCEVAIHKVYIYIQMNIGFCFSGATKDIAVHGSIYPTYLDMIQIDCELISLLFLPSVDRPQKFEIRMLTESMRRNVLYITVSQHDSGIFEAVRQG